MTRIQRERFSDPAVYERLKDSYILGPGKMKLAKEHMCVLHPLPWVNEISVAVGNDPRAAYFRQALNGKYMRMALILMLLKEAEENPAREPLTGELRYDLTCRTPPAASVPPSRNCPRFSGSPIRRQTFTAASTASTLRNDPDRTHRISPVCAAFLRQRAQPPGEDAENGPNTTKGIFHRNEALPSQVICPK